MDMIRLVLVTGILLLVIKETADANIWRAWGLLTVAVAVASEQLI